ncbi:MAG TPA: hypothetical protein EYP61_04780 [Candidatus Latescibacteria bacterium]|nr:hypothetical protein [Candidatus Latescibacterota bacterium]
MDPPPPRSSDRGRPVPIDRPSHPGRSSGTSPPADRGQEPYRDDPSSGEPSPCILPTDFPLPKALGSSPLRQGGHLG